VPYAQRGMEDQGLNPAPVAYPVEFVERTGERRGPKMAKIGDHLG
jgi:hypothetical protein